MKSFLKSLKRQDGFTLVELMVVVAIIGLLSAVAIPNFKKYQAKSKTTEAKLQLSALYTAQTAFFSDYNLYTQCLSYMGFDPSAEAAARYYAVGFAEGVGARDDNAHAAAVNSGMNATICPDDTNLTAGQSYFVAGKGVGGAIVNSLALMNNNATATSSVGTQVDATNMTYVAEAVGVISGDAATATTGSAFTINQLKVISNTQNGY
jgi:type IV pilus assembly protein PilA